MTYIFVVCFLGGGEMHIETTSSLVSVKDGLIHLGNYFFNITQVKYVQLLNK